MLVRFEEWLANQHYREDLIGDLARLPIMQNVDRKPSKQKHNEHKKWVEIVIRIAEPRYIRVFNEAWQEFLLEKEAANSLD